MNLSTFQELREKVEKGGYGDEIEWAENMKPCETADQFFGEYMWVVLCSGMKEQIARIIQQRIDDAVRDGKPLGQAFGHKGKVKAIAHVSEKRVELFDDYQRADDKLKFVESLPWIGSITKYHLAKNLGVDTAKPDRHLLRIAMKYGINYFDMCKELAGLANLRVATVDQIIWRSANLGYI